MCKKQKEKKKSNFKGNVNGPSESFYNPQKSMKKSFYNHAFTPWTTGWIKIVTKWLTFGRYDDVRSYGCQQVRQARNLNEWSITLYSVRCSQSTEDPPPNYTTRVSTSAWLLGRAPAVSETAELLRSLISCTGGGLTTVIGVTRLSDNRPFISRCSWQMAHQCMQQWTMQGSQGEFCHQNRIRDEQGHWNQCTKCICSKYTY